MYVCVEAPGCSPADIPGQFSPFSAGQSGPERPADPESDGRCGSSEHPSAAEVSLAMEENPVLGQCGHRYFATSACYTDVSQSSARFDIC